MTNGSSSPADEPAAETLFKDLAVVLVRKAAALAGNPGEFNDLCLVDGLQDKHTWEYLFNFAFNQFSNEGKSFTDACSDVIKSHANNLGYVFNDAESFTEILSTHLWHSVGFVERPDDDDVSSMSGKMMFTSAIQTLRSHVQEEMNKARMESIGMELMSQLGHLRNGLMILGIMLIGLMVWSVTTCAHAAWIRRGIEAVARKAAEKEEEEIVADKRAVRAVTKAVNDVVVYARRTGPGSSMQMRPLMEGRQ